MGFVLQEPNDRDFSKQNMKRKKLMSHSAQIENSRYLHMIAVIWLLIVYDSEVSC